MGKSSVVVPASRSTRGFFSFVRVGVLLGLATGLLAYGVLALRLYLAPHDGAWALALLVALWPASFAMIDLPGTPWYGEVAYFLWLLTLNGLLYGLIAAAIWPTGRFRRIVTLAVALGALVWWRVLVQIF